MGVEVLKWWVEVEDGGGVMRVSKNEREVEFGNGLGEVGWCGYKSEGGE